MLQRSISLFTLTLLFLLSSCHGQDNPGDIRSRIIQTSPKILSSPTPNQPAKEWISEVVRKVFQDSRGDIWFGAQGGAFRLQGDSLVHIDGIKSETGKGVTIKDITEDPDGTIWLGHTDGLSSVRGDIVKNYYESDGLISNDVWCTTADSRGRIWIGTIEGACVFDGQDFVPFELPEGKIDPTLGVSSTKMIHKILEDRQGNIWISSNAGLFSYSHEKLTNASSMAGIQSPIVNIHFEDSAGGLWVSTREGLYHIVKNKATNVTAGKLELEKGIGSIAEDKDGTIWFVANQHSLYSFDGKEIKEFQKTEDNKGPVVFQIYRDRDDRLWFVGFGGAYRLEDGKFIHVTKTGPW